MRSSIALFALALTACALPPSQSLTPAQQQQMAENQRLGAALLAHSHDGGSTGSIMARAMLDAQSGNRSLQAQKLMLFGGQDHKTYLGCLNCGQLATDSVLNDVGSFGSTLSPTSVRNQFSDFGSPYSMFSACNPYASDPPVIVDSAGDFYGRLTVNAFNPQRTRDEATNRWIAGICAH